jgi:hypothetical protein
MPPSGLLIIPRCCSPADYKGVGVTPIKTFYKVWHVTLKETILFVTNKTNNMFPLSVTLLRSERDLSLVVIHAPVP